MEHTAIPEDELKVFASLENIKVVFDVGARDDVDYLIIKPDIELYAFEPYLTFFEQLQAQIGKREKVFLNNFGLGNKEGIFSYNLGSQAIDEGTVRATKVVVKTLDWYVKKNGIKQIDFLKIDTEGYDLKVLLGGKKSIKLCRYIQYETWDNEKEFVNLLKGNFGFDYIGGRNVICTRKGEKKPWIPLAPKENGLLNKSDKNRL